MHSLRDHYMNLTRYQQIEFRDKLINTLNINVGTFYVWLTRDIIPKTYRKLYAEQVLNLPLLTIYPENETVKTV